MNDTEQHAAMSDAELSALVAKMLGWTHVTKLADDRFCGIPPGKTFDTVGRSMPIVPPYATSADAVCELLKDRSLEINHIHREKIGWQWEAKIYRDGSFFPEETTAPTLARALCLALLYSIQRAAPAKPTSREATRNATREERR
jgi:hypothetical protein